MARFMTNFIVRLIKAFLPKRYCILPVDQLYMVDVTYQVSETAFEAAYNKGIVSDHARRSVVAKVAKELFDRGFVRVQDCPSEEDGVIREYTATVRVIKPTEL